MCFPGTRFESDGGSREGGETREAGDLEKILRISGQALGLDAIDGRGAASQESIVHKMAPIDQTHSFIQQSFSLLQVFELSASEEVHVKKRGSLLRLFNCSIPPISETRSRSGDQIVR